MADQPTNLAQLKRACTPGTRLQIINHARPEISRITVVTKASTVDLITRARWKDGELVDRAHLPWRKAGDWTFDDEGAHLHEGQESSWLDLTVLDATGGDPKLPDLSGPITPGPLWVNVAPEGTLCSVGPFLDSADAAHFQALMFTRPAPGEIAAKPTGERMSVRQFQSAHRADFVGGTHHRPPSRWL